MASEKLSRLALALVDEARLLHVQIGFESARQLLREQIHRVSEQLGVTDATVLRTYLNEQAARDCARAIVEDMHRREREDNESYGGVFLDCASACHLMQLLALGIAGITRLGDADAARPAADLVFGLAGCLVDSDVVELKGARTTRLIDALTLSGETDIDESVVVRRLLQELRELRESSRDGTQRELVVPAIS